MKSESDEMIASYNAEEAKRRKALDEKVAPMLSKIKSLEQEMSLYCSEHREDFGKLKSKTLSNGLVSFRLGTPKVKSLSGFTLKSALQLIKRSIMKDDYIRTKEDINKDAILNDYNEAKAAEDENALPVLAQTLSEVGLEVTQEETFGYEAKVASNKEAAA